MQILFYLNLSTLMKISKIELSLIIISYIACWLYCKYFINLHYMHIIFITRSIHDINNMLHVLQPSKVTWYPSVSMATKWFLALGRPSAWAFPVSKRVSTAIHWERIGNPGPSNTSELSPYGISNAWQNTTLCRI